MSRASFKRSSRAAARTRRALPALLAALLLATPLAAANLPAPALPAVPPPADPRAGQDTMAAASACFAGAPDRTFEVAAISIPIVYNHWGNVDPFGRMYVLASKEAAVRAAVAASPRLPVDLVQPLVIRAHVGDCVEVRFTNRIDDSTLPVRSTLYGAIERSGFGPIVNSFGIVEVPNVGAEVAPHVPPGPSLERASMHVHKALVAAKTQAGSAAGMNADSTVAPGESITYRWYIPDVPGAEGTYYFHSHADPRFQAAHGLFGALIAEPRGYAWLDPSTGAPLESGWEAVLAYPASLPGKAANPDFREAVTIFHDEVEPCEEYSPDYACAALPNVDDARLSGAYGPGTKAINYRSEPFRDRFHHLEGEVLSGNISAYGSSSVGFNNARFDHSQAYGSYMYGDPATPVARAYVGDPTKFRLLHGGPGQHHVFHLHGGGDRWRFQPGLGDTQFAAGKVKEQAPDAIRAESNRLDVQNVGPGESFNLEIEGGAGGVQQSVGDFLYHCHIVEHYVAGMWGIWRVYDTLQDGTNPHFPGQGVLQPLPDRAPPPKAVDSAGLAGKHIFAGTPAERVLVTGPTDLGASPPQVNVQEWVEAFLPARGVPRHDDASVWDWKVKVVGGAPLYLGEHETIFHWPNYEPQTAGLHDAGQGGPGRPVLQFNPDNGRPAYPMLHPHLGKRPPFAPGHGPAPYLGPEHNAAQNPEGLCVQHPDRTSRSYNIVALETPLRYNARHLDPAGQVFVHAADKALVKGNASLAENLVVRANVHDCVDIVFSSALGDDITSGFHSKVNMHVHLVQFDVQGSDGVITGSNFEQSVRPAATGSEMTNLSLAAPAGATVLQVANGSVFRDATGAPKVGSMVGISITEPGFEEARVVAVSGNTVTLDRPLQRSHPAKALVGYEFVKYRWYPDVELGMVYWHDHVDGMRSWTRGLFGGLVVEPARSTWTDPRTGLALRDGTPATASSPYADPHVVDIRVPGEPDYREFVAALQDRACLPAQQGTCAPGAQGDIEDRFYSFNLRNAPWEVRRFANGDPNYYFSSVVHGDPASDMPRAYAGDPVVVRLLYAGQSSTRGVETFAVTGHRFDLERWSPVPSTMAALSFGISSQFNLELECGAGSGYRAVPGDEASCTGHHAGDYLYHLTGQEAIMGGAWGILRVHDKANSTLQPLPDRAPPPGPADTGFPNDVKWATDTLPLVGPVPDPLNLVGPTPLPAQGPGDVGPPGAPVRRFDLAAITLPVEYGPGLVKQNAAFYARLEDVPALAQGLLRPEPLVIRANAGEVVEVRLTNLLALSPASLARLEFSFGGLFSGAMLQQLPADRSSTAALERVSLAPALLSLDPRGSGGVVAGYNPDMGVLPGQTMTYRWYADRELGAAWLQDWARVVDQTKFSSEVIPDPFLSHVLGTQQSAFENLNGESHLRRGLHGLLVVEPAGSTWEHPLTGQPLAAGAAAVVRAPSGAFREFAVLLETEDDQFASSTMPYNPFYEGFAGINYRAQPVASRVGVVGVSECHFNTDSCVHLGERATRSPVMHLATSSVPFGDPVTPLFEAYAGEPVVFRVAGAAGSQLHSFSLDGHAWRLAPGREETNLLDTSTVGPGEVANVAVVAGGGLKEPADAAGDYLYMDHRASSFEAGMWGLFRVHDPAAPPLVGITPL